MFLYDNKTLLWLVAIFSFIGIITVIFILFMFILSIIKKRGNIEKEMENLKKVLSPYEFESTQTNAVNKRFGFMEYLYSGDYVKVIKIFKDYYGFTYQVGEKFYFACAYFLPYEDGYTLYISKDKINVNAIYLQSRKETQGEICFHPEEYFKIIEEGRFKR